MCIRDRGGGETRSQGVAAGDRRGGDAGRDGVEGPCDRLDGCLLYTSDAADDLLRVDLGGRRIIKKKTQTSDNRDYNT